MALFVGCSDAVKYGSRATNTCAACLDQREVLEKQAAEKYPYPSEPRVVRVPTPAGRPRYYRVVDGRLQVSVDVNGVGGPWLPSQHDAQTVAALAELLQNPTVEVD